MKISPISHILSIYKNTQEVKKSGVRTPSFSEPSADFVSNLYYMPLNLISFKGEKKDFRKELEEKYETGAWPQFLNQAVRERIMELNKGKPEDEMKELLKKGTENVWEAAVQFYYEGVTKDDYERIFDDIEEAYNGLDPKYKSKPKKSGKPVTKQLIKISTDVPKTSEDFRARLEASWKNASYISFVEEVFRKTLEGRSDIPENKKEGMLQEALHDVGDKTSYYFVNKNIPQGKNKNWMLTKNWLFNKIVEIYKTLNPDLYEQAPDPQIGSNGERGREREREREKERERERERVRQPKTSIFELTQREKELYDTKGDPEAFKAICLNSGVHEKTARRDLRKAELKIQIQNGTLPDETKSYIENFSRTFKFDEKTVEGFLVQSPDILEKTPEGIKQNIKVLVDLVGSKYLTFEGYLKICTNNPNLFSRNPKTIAEHINIIRFCNINSNNKVAEKDLLRKPVHLNHSSSNVLTEKLIIPKMCEDRRAKEHSDELSGDSRFEEMVIRYLTAHHKKSCGLTRSKEEPYIIKVKNLDCGTDCMAILKKTLKQLARSAGVDESIFKVEEVQYA